MESSDSRVAVATVSASPPALLTMSMIRKLYLPLGERTVFRLISAGRFPKADIGIGGKLRLWRRETVEAWIAQQSRNTLGRASVQ